MPGACSNSWQAYGCDWTVGHLWRSSDSFERLIFVASALLFAYTGFVLSRFYYLYFSARREAHGFAPPSANTERRQKKLVADLSRGLGTLSAIASIAPYLGLAGTCDGVMYRLMRLGIAMSHDSAIVMVASEVGAALITTAAGIIVAISAILSYNLLTTRIESLKCERANRSAVADGSTTESIGRTIGFAQTLPLQRRFSGLPPYALLAAPVLASIVAIFTFFQPYEVPTGLPVRVLPIGSLERHRQSVMPVVVSVVSESGKGTAVVRVNSKATSLDDLDKTLVRQQKGASQREVYVEAEGNLQWGDLVQVIDVVEGVGDGYVVLLTTTPNASSGGNSSLR
jgi:biopolymer transport protein ExbD